MGKPIETFVTNFQHSLENQTFVRLMLSRSLKAADERVDVQLRKFELAVQGVFASKRHAH